jgi:hypothetical protein
MVEMTVTYGFFCSASQINACNGYYCDGFKPNSYNKPVLWTEDWDGWYGDPFLFLGVFKTWMILDLIRNLNNLKFQKVRICYKKSFTYKIVKDKI